MAFLNQEDMRGVGRDTARRMGLTPDQALRKFARDRLDHYDIFLSQTIRDAEVVLGVHSVLVKLGYTVFCDWVEAPSASREDVTPANAAFIRYMMTLSDTLLFLDTDSADQSLWMCWELGWFDGNKGLVAVLPVLSEDTRTYRQREFLGLYPYIDISEDWKLNVVRPVVPGPSGYSIIEAPNSRPFDNWRKQPNEPMRPRTPGYRSLFG